MKLNYLGDLNRLKSDSMFRVVVLFVFILLSNQMFASTVSSVETLVDDADTLTGWNFACGENKTVDEYGANANGKASTDVVLPNSGNIYQYVVEIVYKGANPGSTIQIKDNANKMHTLNRFDVTGSSSNIWVYRGVIQGNTSRINYTNTVNKSNLQSIVVYAFRNTVDAFANSGVFTNLSGYNNKVQFTIDIPTFSEPRDLFVETPISEITTDGRYLLLRAEAGGVSEEIIITGPDSSLPGGTCCLIMPTLELLDVPGSATQVTITVDTRHRQNGQSVNGQSWIIAGGVNVDADCTPSIDPCNAQVSGNLDSDGDGISDLCDLDDDNDGILDTDECVNAASAISPLSLDFSNGVFTDSGASSEVGDKMRYVNAGTFEGTPFDLELVVISNPEPATLDITINNPISTIYLTGANVGALAGLQMNFYQSGTNTLLPMPLDVTWMDVDGIPTSSEEVILNTTDVQFYQLSTSSGLSVINSGGKIRARGVEVNTDNTDANTQDAWWRTRFLTTASINFELRKRLGTPGYNFDVEPLTSAAALVPVTAPASGCNNDIDKRKGYLH